MLQKNDGYFLTEQLLSFYVLLIISTFLLPLLIHLRSQSEEVAMKKQAFQLFYEQLNFIKNEGSSSIEKTWEIDGNLYRVFWDDLKKEACVSVESKNYSDTIGCEKVE